MMALFAALAATSFVLSFVAIAFSVYAYGRVMALKESTHRVEYVPLDSPKLDLEKKKEEETSERPIPERPANYPDF